MLSLIPLIKGAFPLASLAGVMVCLGIVLANHYFWRVIRAKKYPKGPDPWPIFGNAFLFSKIMKDVDRELTSIVKRFGSLCMLWLLSQPVLLVSKLADARELMDKRGAIFSDRQQSNIFWKRLYTYFLPLQGVGEDFRLLRRVYNEILGPKPSESVKKYQEYESRILLRDLYEDPERFIAHTERYSISVIFSAVYGVKVDRLDCAAMVELYKIWEIILDFFLPGTLIIDYLPFLERLPECLQPWVQQANSLRNRETAVHNAFLGILKKQIEAGAESYCFGIDVLKLQEKNGFDDEVALGILRGIVVVGSETTSSMMQSIVKVLAMNPEVQKKAQEELDQIVGPLRLPAWEDSPNLPYIRALIKELHRWTPIFSMGLAHASTQEVSYKGYTIPSKTMIIPNCSALMRDPERYSDPDIFRPERFLGDDLDAFTSAKQGDFLKRDHINYGWGRRLCQGIHVAENSLYMQVARVLWAFDITTRPGEPPLNLSEKEGGMIKKPKPFRVLITPRSDAAIGVLLQSAKEATTDLPDADTVKLAG